MSVYDSILRGLSEALEYEKGNISLRSNSISIAEPEEFSASDIKNIRKASGLSQSAFAAAMGVSVKTVEAWESGRNTPMGSAKRLLAFVEAEPRFFEKMGIVESETMRVTQNFVMHTKAKNTKSAVITVNTAMCKVDNVHVRV